MPPRISFSLSESREPSLLTSMKTSLALLLEAFTFANQLGQDLWDFSVEFRVLKSVGLNINQVRWLLCRGYLMQALETTPRHSARRVFQPIRSLTIHPKSCFVLTDRGINLARGIADRSEDLGSASGQSGISLIYNTSTDSAECEKNHFSRKAPKWRQDVQALFLGPYLIKKYKRPAQNQFVILDTFEVQGWPTRIDNPLVTDLNGEAVERLHDAIKRLNQHHHTPLLRFCGDGTGKGITWKIINGLPIPQ